MKRWRVCLNWDDDTLDVEGELSVDNGVLTFWTPVDPEDENPQEVYRVIRDWVDCFRINAAGEPLRLADEDPAGNDRQFEVSLDMDGSVRVRTLVPGNPHELMTWVTRQLSRPA